MRDFLKVFKPFRGLHAEPPDLDAMFGAALKLRLNFRQVINALDELRMLWPIPNPQDFVGRQWEALSAELHVSALQSLFTTSPSTDEIEFKGGLEEFRRSYPNMFARIVDVLAVSRINYLKASSGGSKPFFLPSDQLSTILEGCSKGHLSHSEQLLKSVSRPS